MLSLTVLASLLLTACGEAPPPAASSPVPREEVVTALPTAPPAMPTEPGVVRQGEKVQVLSKEDSGPGTFRQGLLDAQPGDWISFDEAQFPPDAPTVIHLVSHLPELSQGEITIDASDAGVILDGSALSGNDAFGLDIVSSGNIVRGLQFTGFSGYALGLFAGASDNIIGGDPITGAGPTGQGNLLLSNGIGVQIWDADTSHNTITGNFIGTSPLGAPGMGNDIGVYVQGGGSRNTIGPNNVIAFNSETGIAVENPGSIGNTITRNNIHSNGWMAIRLNDGGNDELQPPVIAGFDLTAGRVNGFTCPGCRVELFSVQDDHSLVFEAEATAEPGGYFLASSGSPFQGAQLTLTATDSEGSTSAFSGVTTGARHVVEMQRANENPFGLFTALPADQLADNRLGDMTSLLSDIQTPHDAAQYLAASNAFGFKRKRLSLDYFDWSEVIAEDPPAYSKFEVNPVHDQLITDLAESGVILLYGLVFWDDQIDSAPTGYARFTDEAEIARYLDYARFIVRHFQGRITYYQILNESFYGEGSDVTQQNIRLADYIEVVRRVSAAIHAVDPEAKVVAGTAPAMFEQGPADYQLDILSSDVIMPLVDAVSWHTGSYPVGREDPIDYLYRCPDTLMLIEETAHAHGFDGEFIADELAWPTSYNPSPSTPWFDFTETMAAKYYGRGIVEHQARGHITLLAGTAYEAGYLKMTVISNLATLLAGASPVDLEARVDAGNNDIVTYSFAYEDGDLLVALWLDGFASEETEAIPATLTLPGVGADEVIGIDILAGLEQRLQVQQSGAGLEIRDLLVKDYPLVLRIGPSPAP